MVAKTTPTKSNKYQEFVKFLANRHDADGLSKSQIVRMADRLVHDGEWKDEHVVRDGETTSGVAQRKIDALEIKIVTLEKSLSNSTSSTDVINGKTRSKGKIKFSGVTEEKTNG